MTEACSGTVPVQVWPAAIHKGHSGLLQTSQNAPYFQKEKKRKHELSSVFESEIFNRTNWLQTQNRELQARGVRREETIPPRLPFWVRLSFSRNKLGTAALSFDHRKAVFTSRSRAFALSATRSFLIQFLISAERIQESFWERKRCWQAMHERRRQVKSAAYWISHAGVRVNISCARRIYEFC